MRVLVLDSNLIHRHFLKSQLKEAGFIVDIAGNIREAEHFVISNKPEIMLMNVRGNEQESIRLIHKWSRSKKNIRIMVLNNNSDLSYKVKALNSGADDYVIIPCEIQEIIIRIKVIVRRDFCIPTQKIKVGNLTLDLSSKLLQIEANTIRLTMFEFEILNLLINNIGRAISKKRLLSKLYTSDNYKNTNTVEVLIGRLRKKLAKYNGGIIKNKREYGYYYENNNQINKKRVN